MEYRINKFLSLFSIHVWHGAKLYLRDQTLFKIENTKERNSDLDLTPTLIEILGGYFLGVLW
jgi:hypothetical protein